MRNYLFLIFFVLICIHIGFGQTKESFNKTIDIKKYEFHIEVNDSTDIIQVEARIYILFKEKMNSFNLDLVNKKIKQKGMIIEEVILDDIPVYFEHVNDRITIHCKINEPNSLRTFLIKYHGVPNDGLIISKNKYGDRTFFGDNWPDRARQWLACVDHPMDKAFVEFHITAPSHYQVIANGVLSEKSNINENFNFYIWKSIVPIPTKVMVIGVARFAVQNIGETHDIPISTWVYPQNKEEGFYDYAQAKEVINYFIETIGPYPFSKLANVQSKTRFGGMENAGNIFYAERSVTGKRKHESLIVHEIAHQWFGNSATESNWEHLWLSEGFATYFTNLYILHKYGNKKFKQLLIDQRKKVIGFSKKQNTPVIDTITQDLMKLLNANSYQKGGWVLHMLYEKLGEKLFWEAITQYYKKYALSNASTEDLKNIFEEVSNQELDIFFNQWLEKSGHPILKSTWKQNGHTIKYHLKQVQKENTVFIFSLDLKLNYTDGTSEIITISIDKKEKTFDLSAKMKVEKIEIDPEVALLYEIKE